MSAKDFYMSVEEFLSVAEEAAVEQQYVKPGEKMHPEDLYYQLDTIMATVAATAKFYLTRDRYTELGEQKRKSALDEFYASLDKHKDQTYNKEPVEKS